MTPMPASPGYNDYVFINCPFDFDYMPLLQAIIYTVYRCGFYPQTALKEDDGSDNRLDKIIRCIRSCKYGVHDTSRVELNQNGFPRFNMPLKSGIYLGAKRFGNGEQKNKIAVVFERTKFSYQQYVSDLNGMDTKAHDNDPNKAIRTRRDWLRTASKQVTIPGHEIIQREYADFRGKRPAIAEGRSAKRLRAKCLYGLTEKRL